MELIEDNGTARLSIIALSDHVLRIRLTRGDQDEDASWAVPAERRAARAAVEVSGHVLRTSALEVRVDPASLALTVTDRAGRLIHADAARPFAFDPDGGFALRKRLGGNERIHGLGDKTGGFDRRGASFTMWNTDTWGYGTATDPTYKSVPFYIAAGGEAGCHGLFLDNTWRTWFDFGHRRDDIVEIAGSGGPVDYYLIAGPGLADVVRRYGWLTGIAPLPPRWALGYQQCRWSFETAAEAREVARRFRAERLPLDAIWLDIHFQDRNRPFTVDATAFPDLPGLVAELADAGIKTVTIADCHVAHAPNEGYAPCDSGLAGDHFLKRADGSLYVGEVWPGPCVFPEFARADTRAWWGSLHRGLVDAGVAGIWDDMNEPAVFTYPAKTMPADVVHRIASDDFAPRQAGHAEMHNVYGLLNTRATAEGLAELRPGLRPFVMTRASFAGGQRYAVTWTGDNNASWEHLRLSIVQLLSLSLSGFAWCGCDIGGFTGGPSADLFTRWIQIGAFMPIMRVHSAIGTPRAKPWVHGKAHTARRRRAIEWRYRLLPYFYAVAREAERSGDPVMRPLAWDFPEAAAKTTVDLSCTFACGPSLLIAPSPRPDGPHPYEVCLPAGTWYDLWSGLAVTADRLTDCGTHAIHRETPTIARLPVFVRAGAIVPLQPLVQTTAEAPQPVLTLRLYRGADGAFTLYHDDGESLAYRDGACFEQRVEWSESEGLLRFAEPHRGHAPWWQRVRVEVLGQDGPGRVEADGKAIATRHDATARRLRFALEGTGACVVRISPLPG